MKTSDVDIKNGSPKTKKLVYTALMAGLLCICSPITVTIGAIPLSLSSFAVYICAVLLGTCMGSVAVGVFVSLGAVGLPVFSGFVGGFSVIAGPTGGYIIGYIPCTFIVAYTVRAFGKKNWAYPLGMMLGTAVLYTIGTLWYSFVTSADPFTALCVCVLPFVLGDALKIAVASFICNRLCVRTKISI